MFITVTILINSYVRSLSNVRKYIYTYIYFNCTKIGFFLYNHNFSLQIQGYTKYRKIGLPKCHVIINVNKWKLTPTYDVLSTVK